MITIARNGGGGGSGCKSRYVSIPIIATAHTNAIASHFITDIDATLRLWVSPLHSGLAISRWRPRRFSRPWLG